jgi:hypothetical protein
VVSAPPSHVVSFWQSPWQPHWPGTPPPPQLWGDEHDPQDRRLPQPSPAGPQETFCDWQVCGTQTDPPSGPPPDAPHMSKPPPPHVCPAEQVPQLSSAPQPSLAGPHV